MEEKRLLQLSFIVAVIGILLMFAGNRLFQPPLVTVSGVKTDYNSVRLQGEITRLTVSKSETVFIKLSDDTGTIDVVVFKGSLETDGLGEGMVVEVLGEPDVYKGNLEIIAKRIQVLSSDLV